MENLFGIEGLGNLLDVATQLVMRYRVNGNLVQNIFFQGKLVSRSFVWETYSFGSHLSGKLTGQE